MENLLSFIKKTTAFRKFQVDDLLFTEFKCPPDDAKSGIWWDRNFFAFILSGESVLKTPRGEYVIKTGECVFARRGSVLTRSQTQEEFCELLVFLPDSFIRDVLHKYNVHIATLPTFKNLDTIIPMDPDDVIQSYFHSLLSYFSRHKHPPETLLKIKFEELILHIASSSAHAPLKWYFHEISARSKPSIRDIMDFNFSSNLTLEEFAQLCSRSLSSFRREFVDLYQMTPGKWLKSRRLEHGRYLLETTMWSIKEICFECGFENRSHFIRVFRDRYGITPGYYRSLHLQHQS